jgi:FAD/FMN-containing dehydrogenase
MDLREKLLQTVGIQNFSDRHDDLIAYSRDHSLVRGCRPACAVRPRNAEEVQKIVKLASESRTPLIPCSSKVHFYGNTVPKLGGIVVDLSGMNRILEFDERNRKVRIEPGVTWRQIEDDLEKKGLRMVILLLPHPERSVVTSWLEREVPIIPIYEYGEPFGGVEVVWPNGDIFRTGSASAPGYPESASKGANFEGPGINFLHLIKGSQGTMGIVTWANVKVEYLPEVNKTFFGFFDDLEKAVGPVYRIQRLRIGYECFVINNCNLALILNEGKREEFERLRATLPPWILILILSGSRWRPEEKIGYQERALLKMKNEEFPEMTISTALPGVPGAGTKLQGLLQKPWPLEETYWKHFYKGGCEDLFFISKLSDAPKFTEIVEKMAVRNGYPLNDLGCYLQPIEYARACHMEFNFYYEPGNSKEIERVQSVKLEAAKALLDQGAFFSRPYGELANMVYERAASYTAVLKRVKNIFDPNHIMNPGNLCF